ncbi:MAG: hypothetical protein GXP25_00810 [Planctomycetes bacterium]|nr:hypothetical protein [Planctomycetota bacterium]
MKIVAGADCTLRLRNPFGRENVQVAGSETRRESDDFLADIEKGQEVIFSLKGVSVDFQDAVEAVRASDVSRLGLR